MKIPAKNVKEIMYRLSKIFSLTNLEEFDDTANGLYSNEPTEWTEFEKNMCDYQARITQQILTMLTDVLGTPFEYKKDKLEQLREKVYNESIIN